MELSSILEVIIFILIILDFAAIIACIIVCIIVTAAEKPKKKMEPTKEPWQYWVNDWPELKGIDFTPLPPTQTVNVNLFLLKGTTTINGKEKDPREAYESIKGCFAEGQQVEINEGDNIICGKIMNTWEEDGWIKGKILLDK